MKQNNRYRTLLTTALFLAAAITTGSLALVSCEKEQPADNNINMPTSKKGSKRGDTLIKLKDSDRQEFSYHLAQTLFENMDAFKELNENIHFIVTEYGLDENLKIYDIMNTNKSVFLNSSSQVKSLRAAFKKSNVLKEYDLTADSFYEDLQLYWPYHDEWDGSTPVICFAPEDYTADEVKGYTYENGEINTVCVNKKDIDEGNHSLIIINQGEVKYEKYPNFNKGKWEKNGCRWTDPKLLKLLLEAKRIEDNSTTNNKVYEASSNYMKSSGTQYDDWGGGSEFLLRSTYAINNLTAETQSGRQEFSRKEIKNYATKGLGMYIQKNWQPKYEDVQLTLVEEDRWCITTSDLIINLSVSGFTLSTTIRIDDDDDMISDQKIGRDNYFHNIDWLNGMFGLGGETFYCSLKIYDSYSNY